MFSQRYNTNFTLLDNASGAVNGAEATWPGGYGFFSGEGTFNAGSVRLQFASARGTWLDVGSSVTLAANGLGGFFLPPGKIRAVTTGAPSAMYAYAYPIPTIVQTGA